MADLRPWLSGLAVDGPAQDAASFAENRDRLLVGDVAVGFLATTVAQPQVASLLRTLDGRVASGPVC